MIVIFEDKISISLSYYHVRLWLHFDVTALLYYHVCFAAQQEVLIIISNELTGSQGEFPMEDVLMDINTVWSDPKVCFLTSAL